MTTPSPFFGLDDSTVSSTSSGSDTHTPDEEDQPFLGLAERIKGGDKGGGCRITDTQPWETPSREAMLESPSADRMTPGLTPLCKRDPPAQPQPVIPCTPGMEATPERPAVFVAETPVSSMRTDAAPFQSQQQSMTAFGANNVSLGDGLFGANTVNFGLFGANTVNFGNGGGRNDHHRAGAIEVSFRIGARTDGRAMAERTTEARAMREMAAEDMVR